MTEIEVKNSIIRCLNETGIEADDFDGAEKISDIFPDSLSYITFIIALEDCFEIELPPEMLGSDNFDSLNDINNYLCNIK